MSSRNREDHTLFFNDRETFSFLVGQKMVSGLAGEDEECMMFGVALTDHWLIIECPWRIRNGLGVLMGDSDLHAKKISYTGIYDLLRQKEVTNVYYNETTADLCIEFDREYYLDLFHESGWFEAWEIRDRKGSRQIIALPGGELCEF
jgi:hypothetical protein